MQVARAESGYNPSWLLGYKEHVTQAGQSDDPHALDSLIGSELACDPRRAVQFTATRDADTKTDKSLSVFLSCAGNKRMSQSRWSRGLLGAILLGSNP